jgi:chromosome segregation ATPase
MEILIGLCVVVIAWLLFDRNKGNKLVKSLKNNNEVLEEHNNILAKDKIKLSTAKEGAVKENNRLKNVVSGLEESVKNCELNRDSYKEESEGFESELTKLRESLKDNVELIVNKVGEITSYDDSPKVKYPETNKKVLTGLQELFTHIDAIWMEVVSLRKKLKDALSDLDFKKRALKTERADNTKLSKEIQSLKDELTKYENDSALKNLRETNTKLSKELEKEIDKNETLSTQKVELETKNQKLKEELDKCKKNLPKKPIKKKKVEKKPTVAKNAKKTELEIHEILDLRDKKPEASQVELAEELGMEKDDTWLLSKLFSGKTYKTYLTSWVKKNPNSKLACELAVELKLENYVNMDCQTDGL